MRILCFSCLHSLTKHDLVLQILPRENKDLLYLYTIIVTIVTIIIIVSIILWLSLIGAHDVWQSRQSFVTSHTLHPCGGVRVERTAVSRGWNFSGHVRGLFCFPFVVLFCSWFFFCLGTPLFGMCSKLLKAFLNHQSNQHQLFHSIENYLGNEN